MKRCDMKRAIACTLLARCSSLSPHLALPIFNTQKPARSPVAQWPGAMKFAGVFSKDARQATQGTTSTISFKGNKMRREDSLGQVEIIDLDARQHHPHRYQEENLLHHDL